ncbi:hypothetical protein V8E51_000146 [Hyaloscypha variabilis]
MHPPGSTCPPPPPPTMVEANRILQQMNDISRRYSDLMRRHNRAVPVVAAVFNEYPDLTRNDIQNLVNRAHALATRVANYRQITQASGRLDREELERLERLYTSREEELQAVEDVLDGREEQNRQLQSQRREPSPRRSSNNNNSSSNSNSNPHHPSDEVLQLRAENSELREENAALGEENRALNSALEGSNDLIRRLRARLAAAEKGEREE